MSTRPRLATSGPCRSSRRSGSCWSSRRRFRRRSGALVLAPALVLLSLVVGGAMFTLVFPPLLVATVVASVLAVSFIIIDGESVWLEGAALLGLYVVVATSFWWG